MEVHSRMNFLAQRLKSGTKEPKSTREIMERKELSKATPQISKV